MKHTITKLEGKNEPINFCNNSLGNYFLEASHGCYEAQPSSIQTKIQFECLHFTQTETNDCPIV
jgi:hypothetical protein